MILHSSEPPFFNGGGSMVQWPVFLKEGAGTFYPVQICLNQGRLVGQIRAGGGTVRVVGTV